MNHTFSSVVEPATTSSFHTIASHSTHNLETNPYPSFFKGYIIALMLSLTFWALVFLVILSVFTPHI